MAIRSGDRSHDSRHFQLASHLHYSLRMALLVKEFKIRLSEPVRVAIGHPLDGDPMAAASGDAGALMDCPRAGICGLEFEVPR
jgi:hypothetical protein